MKWREMSESRQVFTLLLVGARAITVGKWVYDRSGFAETDWKAMEAIQPGMSKRAVERAAGEPLGKTDENGPDGRWSYSGFDVTFQGGVVKSTDPW